MRRTGLLFLLIIFSSFFVLAQDVYVEGYYRSDGTYVRPHYRSSPDGIKSNNYGRASSQQRRQYQNDPIISSYKNDYDNDRTPNAYDYDDDNDGFYDDSDSSQYGVNNHSGNNYNSNYGYGNRYDVGYGDSGLGY
jgi:hypothetical protein